MLATGENQQHLGSKEASSAVYMKTNAVRSQSRLASVGAYKLQTSMTKLSEINTAKVMIHSAHSSFTCPVIDPKLVKSSYFFTSMPLPTGCLQEASKSFSNNRV